MNENIKKNDVSVVVCAKNAEKTIIECLKSIKDNNPKEIILVDARSKDNTLELAKPYVDIMVQDPGLGLAVARNYGLQHVSAKYVCNVGPDNVLPENFLSEMVNYLENNHFTGVSSQTFIKDYNKSYLSYALNLYKKVRFYPGKRDVIGTPHLFLSEVLKNNKFDDSMSWSDDADLCNRLSKMGHKFAISDAFVFEIGQDSIKSIILRWKGYGLSDFEFYKKYSRDWGSKRKVFSFLHPFLVDFLGPITSKRLNIKEKTFILPFLIYITFLRYKSWIKSCQKIKT